MNEMSHGLKMSKLFSKGQYEALKYVQPYWKKAQETPSDLDVTIVTTTTPESWKDFVNLVENWDGKYIINIIYFSVILMLYDRTYIRHFTYIQSSFC